MLSISNPQKASQAESYYTEENYYQKNSEIGVFRGLALKILGLKSGQEVTQDIYKSLLHGYNPSTLEKLTNNAGDVNRRAGIDLTFSAPKSVSTLLEIAEANGSETLATQIRKAHDTAVQRTMQKVEKNYLYTRVSLGDNNIQTVKADSMMYASFQHDTSRSLDPQLHTHNFIFNQVLKDGKFNALSNEELFKNKMYFGQFYRNELAYNLKEIGLDVSITDSKKGFFEIDTIKQDIINEFSQRANQIKNLEETYKKKYPNISKTELKALITQASKKAKQKVDRDVVREENKERADALGYDKEWLKNFEQTQSIQHPHTKEEIEKLSLGFINKSIEAITEYQSVFNKEELLKHSLKFGLKYGIREHDILKQVKHSNLIRLEKNNYTSQEMIDMEKEIISNIHQGFNTSSNALMEYVDTTRLSTLDELTSDQKKMIELILNTTDKYIAIQGDAGTGKTFALEKAKELLNDKVELIGVSYTGKAASGLEEVGIPSQTFHALLNTKEETSTTKPKVYIVDETGLAGSKQIHQLMERAKHENARVVFLGDVKQFSSIQAGNIFADIQKYGIQKVELKETKRQKTKLTKAVVKAYNQSDTDKSLNILEEEKRFTEKESYEERIDFTVEQYKKNKNLLIITSKNAERTALNETIRSIDSVQTKEHLFTIKEAKQISPIDAYFSESYAVDDIVVINGKVPLFKTGQQGKIVSIDNKKNTLDIAFDTKHTTKVKTLDLKEFANKITIYNEVKKSFKEEEKIIFTKNIQNTPIKNGVLATITKIEKNQVHTKLENGNTYQFNMKEYNYIDYGYAITDYKAQGVTADDVLVLADSSMANKNSFYVQVTRAKNSIEVVTDNKERLRDNIRIKDEKLSTLDYTIGDIYATNKPRDYGQTRRDRLNTTTATKLSTITRQRADSYLRDIKKVFLSIKQRLAPQTHKHQQERKNRILQKFNNQKKSIQRER